MGVLVGVTGKRSDGKATIPLFLYRGGGIRTPDLSVPNRAKCISPVIPDGINPLKSDKIGSLSITTLPCFSGESVVESVVTIRSQLHESSGRIRLFLRKVKEVGRSLFSFCERDHAK